jgi:hypothetical protein
MGWTDDAAEVHMAERQYDLQRKRQQCEVRTMPSVAMNLPHTADSNVTLLQLSSEMKTLRNCGRVATFQLNSQSQKHKKLSADVLIEVRRRHVRLWHLADILITVPNATFGGKADIGACLEAVHSRRLADRAARLFRVEPIP